MAVPRRDPLDVNLTDMALREEVEILVRLIAAANASKTSLDTVTIDALLLPEQ